MTLYIYNTESNEHVASIIAQDNNHCEAVANDRFGDTDTYGWTYSPAFGFDGGLVENNDAEIIDISYIKEQIRDSADNLGHDYIVLDALDNDSNPDIEVYTETITKIKDVENNYTDEEILAGNLLVDIW